MIGFLACLTISTAWPAEKMGVFVQLGHSGAVWSVAFSPDGRTLASTGQDGTIKLWDVASGYELRSLSKDSYSFYSTRFLPDGRVLAVAANDTSIKLWDTASGSALPVLGRDSAERINGLIITPDGRILALTSFGTIKLLDAASGSELRTLEGSSDPIIATAFSPDGRILASRSYHNTVTLWDVASGSKLHALKGISGESRHIAFSPDGHTLATANEDGSATLWDVASGSQLRIVGRHQQSDQPIAFSPDGGTLALGGGEHDVELWKVADGSALRTLSGHSSTILSIAFSADGRTIAAGSFDHRIELWDVASGSGLRTLSGHSDSIRSVAFLPGGGILATGSEDHTIRLWDTASGRGLRTLSGHSGPVDALAFSPDGRVLASGCAITANDPDSRDGIKLWDVASGNELHTLNEPCKGPRRFTFSPDSRTLALGGKDTAGFMHVFWDADGGTKSRDLRTAASWDERITVFSPDFHILASAAKDTSIKLWDATNASELRTLSKGSNNSLDEISALAFSPDSHILAAADQRNLAPGGHSDISIRLWDVASGTSLRTLIGGPASVTDLAFSPDGQILASTSFNTIKLWNLASGSQLRILNGPLNFNAVAFSPDGRSLATGSDDHTVELWDASSGRELARLIAFDDRSSVVITPEGYYDYSGTTAEDHLLVRYGSQLRDVTSIGSYREKFYRPDLVRMALSGQALPSSLGTLDSVKPAPEVSLAGTPSQIDQDTLNLQLNLSDRGGGIGDVRVLINGAVVSQAAGRDLGISAAPGAPTRTIPVRLVPGNNDIQVIVFNAEGSVHSNPATAKVVANYTPRHKPRLYALVIGIDHFENPNLQLRYSVADATAVAEKLRKKAAPLFDTVNVDLHTTPAATTKQVLESALASYKSIAADDVFIFYVASHGTVEGDLASKEYFLVPSNVGMTSDQALRRDAISQTELKQLIAGIPATKKLLLLDTCHSGALADAMAGRGLDEQDAVNVLSGAVGSMILSASTSQQQALEGQQGHGVFTWVLLQGLDGKADLRNSGFITTVDLASYVTVEVPKVAEQVFKQKQFPNLTNVGQTFPVVSSR